MTHYSYPSHIKVPPELSGMILDRIRHIERRNSWMQFVASSVVSIGSFVLSVNVISSIMHEASTSGFSSYLSLITSDSAVLIATWKEFMITLAESLPTVSIIALLASIGLFIWTTAVATRTVRAVPLFT